MHLGAPEDLVHQIHSQFETLCRKHRRQRNTRSHPVCASLILPVFPSLLGCYWGLTTGWVAPVFILGTSYNLWPASTNTGADELQ